MPGRSRFAVVGLLAFVAWTLLIWTTRIGNIWRDDDLGTAGKVGNTALAGSFVVLALVVVAAAVRATPAVARRALGLLAGWTVGVWLVRSVDILLDDWSGAFKVVHTGLAVISIVLAGLAVRSAWALRAVSAQAEDGHEPESTPADVG